ncbi:hypothetical protein GCM10009834_26400 [Streptomonospora arabica]
MSSNTTLTSAKPTQARIVSTAVAVTALPGRAGALAKGPDAEGEIEDAMGRFDPAGPPARHPRPGEIRGHRSPASGAAARAPAAARGPPRRRGRRQGRGRLTVEERRNSRLSDSVPS